jgi:hypothetical protein
MTVGVSSYTINGQSFPMETDGSPVAPVNVGGRVFVPLRFFAEAGFGQVEWRGSAIGAELIP